jgi:hypothetical protein
MFNPGGKVYRALVTSANSTTGEIYVSIPQVMGQDSSVPLSYVGRSAANGIWAVPDPGEVIVVASDDDQFSNVFWIKTTSGTNGGSA